MRPYFSKNFFCHTHILPAQKNLGVVNGSNQITKQAAIPNRVNKKRHTTAKECLKERREGKGEEIEKE